VDRQKIQVSFAPQPEPTIHVITEYRLRNSGIQELESLDVRLPGRRFNPADVTVSWDGATIPQPAAAENSRDTLIRFPKPWSIGASHTLKLAYVIRSVSARKDSLGFSADAFYLPAEGWAPSLFRARGAFTFGGAPPAKWELVVQIPQGFLVHASGGREKHSRKNAETEYRFEQTVLDLNPFVVAGRYREARENLAGNQRVTVWSRAELDPAELRRAGDSLARTLAIYDSLFGFRGKSRPPLWIVECPAEQGCFSQRGTVYSTFIYGETAGDSAEMISRDTAMIGSSFSSGQREALAGPALAAGWLGYGHNPSFLEQQPPMSALPAFAAAMARESATGPQVRAEIIQRALAKIPAPASRESNDDPVIARAKALLLFYALRDRVGHDNFQKAIQHMLSARQARGLDITDLISALEEQSHQSVGPFVREWVKRPGVPESFRAMYSQSTARQDSTVQEAAQ
jgi:hypothetical protein